MSDPVDGPAPNPQLSAPTREYVLTPNSSLLLDALRAVAAEAVVVGHGVGLFYYYPRPLPQPPAFPYAQEIAVVVFFLLSGFLITYATLRKPSTYRFREFLIDRFARIYPALLVVLPVVFFVDRLSHALDPDRFDFGNSLGIKTFAANVLMLEVPQISVHLGSFAVPFGSARPLWTLAIEWWIYLGFGWFVLRHRKSLAWWLPVLVASALIPMYLTVVGSPLVIMWLLGSCLYLVLAGGRLASVRASTVAVGLVSFLAAAVLLIGRTNQAYDLRFAALCAASLLCLVLIADGCGAQVSPRIASAIRIFAGYSFTLYLMHYSVLYFLVLHSPIRSPQANLWVGFVLANGAALAIASVTEMRHRAFGAWLKSKLSPPDDNRRGVPVR
jgi:peptidoglycan/LPS O-acetylase OafA/YrhL